MPDHHASLDAALARSAAPAERFAADHVIRWTFDHGGVTSEAVCNAGPGADCRLTSVACECERWGEIQRRDDGTIWHKIVDYGESIEPVWHEVVPADYCNVALFINESECVDELGAGSFVIGEVPFKPLWVDDGCEWEPINAALAAVADDGLAERVRALADEWASWSVRRSTPRIDAFRDAADELRALLSPAPSTGRDERDGA